MTANSGAYTDSTRPGTFAQNYDRRALIAVNQQNNSTGGWAKIGSTLEGKPLPIAYDNNWIEDEPNNDIPMQSQGRGQEADAQEGQGFFITEADAKR